MKITAETTNEQILAPIQAAKDALVQAATEAQSSEYLRGKDLVSAAQRVRNAEELATAQMLYRDHLKGAPEKAPFILFNLVSRVDDRWSGRGNDSTRAAHDVVVEWATNAMDDIRYGA